jgi:hypothetical protein
MKSGKMPKVSRKCPAVCRGFPGMGGMPGMGMPGMGMPGMGMPGMAVAARRHA